MLGEGGRYVKDCLDNNYIGVNFLKDIDLSNIPHTDESVWKQNLVAKYLESHPDKTSATARMAIGFMWTVCYGLKTGDVVLAPNGEGGYYVAEITGSYFYAQGKELSHRRTVKVSVSAILSCRPFFILIFLPCIKMNHYGFSRKSIWKNLETFP